MRPECISVDGKDTWSVILLSSKKNKQTEFVIIFVWHLKVKKGVVIFNNL